MTPSREAELMERLRKRAPSLAEKFRDDERRLEEMYRKKNEKGPLFYCLVIGLWIPIIGTGHLFESLIGRRYPEIRYVTYVAGCAFCIGVYYALAKYADAKCSKRHSTDDQPS